MPTKKSTSSSTEAAGAGRPGLTLLEITIAGAIGLVLTTLAIQAYVGANKAQNVTIASSMMKTSGQATLHDLYAKLHQSHTIFDRGAMADSWLSKVPVDSTFYTGTAALTPGYDTALTRLPLINPTAAFSTAEAGWINGAMGNALFFSTAEPEAIMRENSGSTRLFQAFGTSEVHLTPYRLQLYVLAKRALPLDAPAFKPGVRYSWQLMSWTSAPYLDYQDMLDWMAKLKAAGASDSYVDGKLTNLASAYAGIVDLGSSTGTNAIRKLAANGTHTDFTLETAPFKTFQYRLASKNNLKAGIGEVFVAFNTSQVPIPNVQVPGFEAASTTLPFGFETLVGGPTSGRQVMLRLAYGARTTPGNVLTGQTFQQVVQIFAEVPAQAATAGPTTAATAAPSAAGT